MSRKKKTLTKAVTDAIAKAMSRGHAGSGGGGGSSGSGGGDWR